MVHWEFLQQSTWFLKFFPSHHHHVKSYAISSLHKLWVPRKSEPNVSKWLLQRFRSNAHLKVHTCLKRCVDFAMYELGMVRIFAHYVKRFARLVSFPCRRPISHWNRCSELQNRKTRVTPLGSAASLTSIWLNQAVQPNTDAAWRYL